MDQQSKERRAAVDALLILIVLLAIGFVMLGIAALVLLGAAVLR